MGHFKTFMLGMLTAYGVYYITRKNERGKSMLDDMLDHPKQYLSQAKDALLGDAVRAVKEAIT